MRPPNRSSAVQSQIKNIAIFIETYIAGKQGRFPESWEELKSAFPEDVRHFSRGDKTWWPLLERRFAFVNVEGEITRAKDGPRSGRILLVGMFPFKDFGRKEDGQYVVWMTAPDDVFAQWHSQPELETFSHWPELEAKLKQARAELAKLPALDIESTPFPAPGATVSASPQVSTNTTPAPALGDASAPRAERRVPVWPWLVGIAVLIGSAALFLKRANR